MRRRTAVPTVVVLVLLAGCGSSGSAGGGTTTAPTSTATSTSTTAAPGATTTAPPAGTTTAGTQANQRRQQVGQVVDIVPSGGRADGDRVDEGSPLFSGAVLATEPAGSVYFTAGGKLRRCNVRPGSSVRLAPGGDVLVEFVSGKTWCETTTDDAVVTFRAGGQTLRAADPVFSVEVADDGRVELQVAQGFVLAGEGDDAVVVGEGQRAGLAAGSSPELGPFGLDQLAGGGADPEREVAGNMRSAVTRSLPAPNLARIDVRRSPTLRPASVPSTAPPVTSTIDSTAEPPTTGPPTTRPAAGRPTLVVLVTGDDSAVGAAGDLLRRLLAPSGVQVEVEPASVDKARAALARGDAGMVVSAAKVDGASVPLFDDGDGDGPAWRAWFDADDAAMRATLESGLRTLLQASCGADGTGSLAKRGEGEDSCYEALYLRSYGSDPVPLTPFAGLLGLPR